MSLVDLVASNVETPRLFGERVYLINIYESLNGIISNYQSGQFMSWLCMLSFDLRYQRHFMDGSYFDYDL